MGRAYRPAPQTAFGTNEKIRLIRGGYWCAIRDSNPGHPD